MPTVSLDVTELIRADHERIRRLFAALDDAARYEAADWAGGRGPAWMLPSMWARIASLIGLHADAEQEICFLPMFGPGRDRVCDLEAAVADLNDLRDAVAEAALQHPGSPAWWRAVNAARRSAYDHIAVIDDGVVSKFRERCDMRLRDDLGRQWKRFIAARRRDGWPSAPPR
jgi:hypothetical protein